MTAGKSPSAKTPLAFMLLWKPSNYNWEADGLANQTESLRRGWGSRSSWSVNNFPKRIQPGDRVFMRRTSDAPLGVIGEGVVASDVYWAPSYKDGDMRDFPYVDIDWVSLAPADPMPPIALDAPVPAITHRWASIIYEQDELNTLDHAWTRHLDATDGARMGALPRTTRKAVREERTFQGQFRRLILNTYGAFCTVCDLDIESILDAAHIESHASGGQPTAENGRPLCANHHRAFDRNLLRWSPATEAFEWVDPELEF